MIVIRSYPRPGVPASAAPVAPNRSAVGVRIAVTGGAASGAVS